MALTGIGNIHTNEFKDVDLDSTPESIKTSSATFFGASMDNSANDEEEFIRGYDVGSSPSVGTTQPSFIAKAAKGQKRVYLSNMGIGFPLANGLFVACVEESGTSGSSSPDSDVTSTIWTS